MPVAYPKVAQFKTPEEFRARLVELGLDLPVDDRVLSAEEGSPLAQPFKIGTFKVGNRWSIHPMEGWDANPDGSPSEYTLRRWENFGRSGAKLIWGGEAAAVQHDGRANPRQLLATPENKAGLAKLRDSLVAAHQKAFGNTDDLLVGLQLTHSGRFSKPNDNHRLEPLIAYHHPLLDLRFGISPKNDMMVWVESDLEQLIDNFVLAARTAKEAGFQFVDVKACHGYLLHEFLGARSRSGKYGGDLEGRSRLLTTIVTRIRDEVPGLMIGVRLSVFDIVPFQAGPDVGVPMPYAHLLPYPHGFGVNAQNPELPDLREPLKLIHRLRGLRVAAINLSCGSPYYNPHIQRPAIFPPSDGYMPPEDPLVGVARMIQAAKACQEANPGFPLIGTGYTYLQDYLPHVAQAVVKKGWITSVGLGRMVLAYPEMPADTLAGREWQRKRVCRTFSDCTTAPRSGLISGCYPLDPFYKALPEAEKVKQLHGK